MENKNIYIAIAGNIGSGKTTLTEMLAKQLNFTPQFEQVDDNPYIADFYDDMKHWAFHMQVYFLNRRHSTLLDILNADAPTIMDRTIYEDAHIFAANLHEIGNMSSRDFETYINLYRTIISALPAPKVLIYLKGSISKLVEQIQERGREYEENISIDYLKRLNQKYDNWYSTYNKGPKFIVDIDKLDFKRDESAMEFIQKEVSKYIY